MTIITTEVGNFFKILIFELHQEHASLPLLVMTPKFIIGKKRLDFIENKKLST